jgi:hypothetical protein
MGTIIGRTRKDGSKAFTARIVIKKGGAIVHREAETFDRKQAANAWIVKREAELKRPDGLQRKADPTLAAVIERYIKESRNPVLGSKAQCSALLSEAWDFHCSHVSALMIPGEQTRFGQRGNSGHHKLPPHIFT